LKKLPLATFKTKLKEFLLNRYFKTWIFIVYINMHARTMHARNINMHARNLLLLKFILLRYIQTFYNFLL
jgi:hypothetical protein